MDPHRSFDPETFALRSGRGGTATRAGHPAIIGTKASGDDIRARLVAQAAREHLIAEAGLRPARPLPTRRLGRVVAAMLARLRPRRAPLAGEPAPRSGFEPKPTSR